MKKVFCLLFCAMILFAQHANALPLYKFVEIGGFCFACPDGFTLEKSSKNAQGYKSFYSDLAFIASYMYEPDLETIYSKPAPEALEIFKSLLKQFLAEYENAKIIDCEKSGGCYKALCEYYDTAYGGMIFSINAIGQNGLLNVLCTHGKDNSKELASGIYKAITCIEYK